MGINGERVTRTAQHGLSHVLGPSNNSATRSRGSAQGLDFSGRNHDNAQCHSVTHSPPLTTDRHRPGKRQLGATLLGVYLGFAPIYWLPYLDPVALRGAKAVFLIAALALVLVTRRTGILFPAGLLSPASFLVLLLLAVPGMFQAVSFGTVLQFIFDVVLSAVFLWVFFTLRFARSIHRIHLSDRFDCRRFVCAASVARRAHGHPSLPVAVRQSDVLCYGVWRRAYRLGECDCPLLAVRDRDGDGQETCEDGCACLRSDRRIDNRRSSDREWRQDRDYHGSLLANRSTCGSAPERDSRSQA